MSELDPSAPEVPLSAEDVNDFNSTVIGRLRRFLEDDYAPPGFFEEGEPSSEIPPFTISTRDGDYSFARIGRRYLHVVMSKLPAGELTPSFEEKVEFIYGEKPLIRYKFRNERPKRNTSQAVRKTMQFMVDLESHLLLQS